ncbi:hypothetical protein [Bacillus thuringiensis]|uniref:hypothetical protein n=1 Tax=Bacillus thuringiensis TaxID=1428 RepID=UPI000BFC959B|nr:hypothetical protein [Bacillus thuringiensis]PGT89869.1 hypothetical protein COD17_08960 [Bacillus thuringiensis]
MSKKEESNIQGKQVEENLIFDGERDIMQYCGMDEDMQYRMGKIADMLSKVVEGKDFTVQEDEVEYLLEALKSMDKGVQVSADYLEKAGGVKPASRETIIEHLKKPLAIVVASEKDKANERICVGIQYIWVRE